MRVGAPAHILNGPASSSARRRDVLKRKQPAFPQPDVASATSPRPGLSAPGLRLSVRPAIQSPMTAPGSSKFFKIAFVVELVLVVGALAFGGGGFAAAVVSIVALIYVGIVGFAVALGGFARHSGDPFMRFFLGLHVLIGGGALLVYGVGKYQRRQLYNEIHHNVVVSEQARALIAGKQVAALRTYLGEHQDLRIDSVIDAAVCPEDHSAPHAEIVTLLLARAPGLDLSEVSIGCSAVSMRALLALKLPKLNFDVDQLRHAKSADTPQPTVSACGASSAPFQVGNTLEPGWVGRRERSDHVDSDWASRGHRVRHHRSSQRLLEPSAYRLQLRLTRARPHASRRVGERCVRHSLRAGLVHRIEHRDCHRGDFTLSKCGRVYAVHF
jgi:hypothetical protein